MTNPHPETCACAHDHAHGETHDHHPMKLSHRWLLSGMIVGVLLVLLRPFLAGQMLVRVTSYSANASYSDAVRVCQKIIIIDPENIKAWTSLGYAYKDMARMDMSVRAFEKVLGLNPEDRGAASYELGQAYFAKGEFLKASECFERVRSAGPRAAALLDADILKYRHGTLGFRSLNSMQALLGSLLECYRKTGNDVKAAEIQKEYDVYKSKHRKILF